MYEEPCLYLFMEYVTYLCTFPLYLNYKIQMDARSNKQSIFLMIITSHTIILIFIALNKFHCNGSFILNNFIYTLKI